MPPETHPPPTEGTGAAAEIRTWLGGFNPDATNTPNEADVQVWHPDLLHEHAASQRLAERTQLNRALARHGICEVHQAATDWIGAAHILTGGGCYSPFPWPILDPVARRDWLYCVTPIRDPDGELANLVAWRPDRAETFLRMSWPAVLGAGIPGDEDDPIGRALICNEPVVVYGSVAAWHRQAMGPGVVLLGNAADLGCTRRAVTDDIATAGRLHRAGIDARVYGGAANAA